MITGYILAGGRSSRMGCDKAFLPVDGQPLIQRVIQRLRPHVDTIVAIGHARNRPHLEDLPVDAVLTDLSPDLGPLMGVYTGLMHSEAALHLFVSCDMPWIAGPLLRRLTRSARAEAPLVAGQGPDGRLYPLPMVCRRQVCRLAGRLLDRRQRSLRGLVQAAGAHVIRIDEPELLESLRNLNTVSDYVSACGMADARGPQPWRIA